MSGRAAAIIVVIVVSLLGSFVSYMLHPKCYIAIVDAKSSAGDYSLRKTCKTKSEAEAMIENMVHGVPPGYHITGADIYDEARGWFCE